MENFLCQTRWNTKSVDPNTLVKMPSSTPIPKHRGRGRPRKGMEVNRKPAIPIAVTPNPYKTTVGRPRLLTASSPRERDTTGDSSTTMQSRRSKRYRIVDPHKELIIVKPKEDLQVRFNLTDKELVELKACMKEVVDYGEDSKSEGSVDGCGISHEGLSAYFSADQLKILNGRSKSISAKTVFTPTAVLMETDENSRNNRPVRRVKCKIGEKKADSSSRSTDREAKAACETSVAAENLLYKQQFIQYSGGSDIVCYQYGDYEIDSDDDEKITLINQSFNECHGNSKGKHEQSLVKLPVLTVDCFEDMIAALERELQTALNMKDIKDDVRLCSERCRLSLETSRRVIGSLEASICTTSTNNDSHDMLPTIATLGSLLRAIDSINSEYSQSTKIADESFLRSNDNPSLRLANSAITTAITTATTTAITTESFGRNTRGRKRKVDTQQVSITAPPVISRELFNANGNNSPHGNTLVIHTENSDGAHDQQALQGLVPANIAFCILNQILIYRCKKDPRLNAQYLTDVDSIENDSWKDAIQDNVGRLIDEVYTYWVAKRAGKSTSFLRCYHDYIMHNWQRDAFALVDPVLPEDLDLLGLQNARQKLVSLRRDLDRARLIVDRVRRRERLKRDLLRLSIEALDINMSSNPDSVGVDSGSCCRFLLEPAAVSSDNSNSNDVSMYGDEESGSFVDSVNQSNQLICETTLTSSNLAECIPSQSLVKGCASSSTVSTSSASPETLPGIPIKAAGLSPGVWNNDCVKLLLMGVGACGVNYWDQIQQEFGFGTQYPCSFLSERFLTLAAERYDKCQPMEAVDLQDSISLTSHSSNLTASIEPVSRPTLSLTKRVAAMLASFNEELTWERIAIRLLTDGTYIGSNSTPTCIAKDQKYPKLAIPERFQKSRHTKYKYLLTKVPSLLTEQEVMKYIAANLSRTSAQSVSSRVGFTSMDEKSRPAGPVHDETIAKGGNIQSINSGPATVSCESDYFDQNKSLKRMRSDSENSILQKDAAKRKKANRICTSDDELESLDRDGDMNLSINHCTSNPNATICEINSVRHDEVKMNANLPPGEANLSASGDHHGWSVSAAHSDIINTANKTVYLTPTIAKDEYADIQTPNYYRMAGSTSVQTVVSNLPYYSDGSSNRLKDEMSLLSDTATKRNYGVSEDKDKDRSNTSTNSIDCHSLSPMSGQAHRSTTTTTTTTTGLVSLQRRTLSNPRCSLSSLPSYSQNMQQFKHNPNGSNATMASSSIWDVPVIAKNEVPKSYEVDKSIQTPLVDSATFGYRERTHSTSSKSSNHSSHSEGSDFDRIINTDQQVHVSKSYKAQRQEYFSGSFQNDHFLSAGVGRRFSDRNNQI